MNKLENLDKMDKLLERHKLLKTNSKYRNRIDLGQSFHYRQLIFYKSARVFNGGKDKAFLKKWSWNNWIEQQTNKKKWRYFTLIIPKKINSK